MVLRFESVELRSEGNVCSGPLGCVAHNMNSIYLSASGDGFLGKELQNLVDQGDWV